MRYRLLFIKNVPTAEAEEWQILILSHQPLDYWVANDEYSLSYIVNAYKNGTSWSGNGLSCNFSGKNKALLIGNIHGHIHNFLTDYMFLGHSNCVTKTTVYRMSTPNACYGRENQYSGAWGEVTTYSKTPNTATDTAFCVYCVDLDAKTIKAICYGAGYDRLISYVTTIVTYSIQHNLSNITSSNPISLIEEGESFTSTLTANEGYEIESITVTMGGTNITSSVVSGSTINIASVTGDIVITATSKGVQTLVNLLDTVGYTDGMRFSSSNGVEKSETGCVATGYIYTGDMTYDDKIYAYGEGVILNNANATGKCVLVSYDDSKAVKTQNYTTDGAKLSNLTVSFDANGIMTISKHGDVNPAYIRFSGVGSGANLIVTKNQPIPIS
jgi:hypothetical protein